MFWKKCLLSFFCILLSLSITAEVSVLKKNELRILDIGNSYTNDATNLLPIIVNASKADLSKFCIYKCHRGGASFKTWVDVFNDKDQATYTVKKVIGDLSTNVQTGTGEKENGKLFRDALINETWDLIIIHQVSNYAPYYSKWKEKSSAGYLDELISIIKKYQPNTKLGFYLIHSYWSEYENNTERSSFERWQLIANSTKSFCDDYNIDIVIPYGTAIQNLRASSLNNEYDLTRDGTHCGYGLAQYTAACCYYEALIGPRCGISVLGNSARIDVSDKESKYPSINVTDDNAPIAQRAAYLAIKDMYNCQNPELKVFKLTYLVDGEEYKSYDIEYGAPITPEPAPTKDGYIFSGWSDIPETMPARNVTVTGTFTANTYRLTYIVDGVEYKSYTIDNGATITPEPVPTKDGYTFSGWSEIPQTMPDHDVAVTGTFTANTYRLTYIVDGVEYKSYTIEYGATITPEPAPTKDGYIFSGWSDIPETMPANDVTVTGNFTRISVFMDDVAYELIGDAVVIGKSENAKGDVKIESSVEINGQTYLVTTIGKGAFQGCTELTSVEIPSSVITISGNAFEGCTNLLVIKIGSGIKVIESRAFANNGTNNARTRGGHSGVHVYCEAESIPYAHSSTFEGTPIEKGTLHIVDDLVGAYKFQYPWKGFGTIVGLTEDTGVKIIMLDSTDALIYDMQGRRIARLQKGMNIIRMSDGKTKKVMGN